MAEYVYRNADDTARAVVFRDDFRVKPVGQREAWDVRLFHDPPRKGDGTALQAHGGTDGWPTRRAAKAAATRLIGKLTSINPKDSYTQGWDQ